MPRIEEIDRNFTAKSPSPGGTYQSIDAPPFTVYGLAGKDDNGYYRMPQATAEAIGGNIPFLCRHTAGGIIRFSTNAKTLSVKVEKPKNCCVMPHMAALGSCGFDVYYGKRFVCSFQPPIPVGEWEQEQKLWDFDEEPVFHDYTVYMPLYGAYENIFLKVNEGAEIRMEKVPFRNEKPILFYGSSITQGACAGKPSMAFSNILSREHHLYIQNLGFSGGAHAEDAAIDYISTRDMYAFVMDYDHNSDDEELEKRHLHFYRKIRAANPDLPILLATSVPFLNHRGYHAKFRQGVIHKTYEIAKSEGDTRIGYINGFEFFSETPYDLCTQDGVHPNDLGMYLMYRGFEKGLSALLPELF